MAELRLAMALGLAGSPDSSCRALRQEKSFSMLMMFWSEIRLAMGVDLAGSPDSSCRALRQEKSFSMLMMFWLNLDSLWLQSMD